MADPETARRVLSLIDLTDLNDDSSADAVRALAGRATTPHGHVAAICIWPRFVKAAKPVLAGTAVRIATVVNFPSGDEPLADTVALTRQAIGDGADEIDTVIPWLALKLGKVNAVKEHVRALREACGPTLLKVIIESGKLTAPELIRTAAELAIASGADFIKTSTGKVDINATPEAAQIMLSVIANGNRSIGFKPAGGIRTMADASTYLQIAADLLGPDWATPQTFRFGASGLLGAVLAELDGEPGPASASAY
jgi:deoxyribose-phosphate aldolase